MSDGSWVEIPPSGLGVWNEQLTKTEAHLFQYPLWNEPYRSAWLRPRYFTDGNGGFVAVLALNLPGARYGFIRGGPVVPAGAEPPTSASFDALLTTLRDAGFVGVRFSMPDEAQVGPLAAAVPCERSDPLPLIAHHEHELFVELIEDEAEQLSRWQGKARRDYRNASRAGFEVTHHGDRASLEVAAPLFEAMNRRKGQRIYRRAMSSYFRLVERAAVENMVDIFHVHLAGRIVQCIVVIRAGTTAYYVMGALDTQALRGKTGNSQLVHWTAMRHAFACGARRYSLGSEYGTSVEVFKMKFRPDRVTYAMPVTVPLRRTRHALLATTALTVRRLIGLRSRIHQRATVQSPGGTSTRDDAE